MAGNDSELKVVISSDVSGLQEGADQASESADTIAEHLEALKSQAESGADGLDEAGKSAGAFGAALSSMGQIAAGVFGGLELEGLKDKFESFFETATLGTFEWGESLTNLGISTGLTSEQLQVLQYAADVTGVNFDKLQQVVNRLSLAMLQFQQGSKTVVNAAQVLGIDPSTFNDAYDALGKIGERVKEIGTLTLEQRGAIEEFLGGRGGAQILPAIERLQEFQDEAKATGVILSDDMVKSSDEAAESINRLSAAWGALEHQIGATLAPAATLAVQGIGERVFGLQPDEGGGVAGDDKGSGERQAETLQPATDAQQTLKAAIDSTTGSIDMQTAAMTEFAGIAPQTLSQIRELAEADNAAFDEMNDEFKTLGGDTLDHIKEKWGELDAAEQQAVQDLKANSEVIASAVTPITSAFETAFDGVIAGTQTMSQAWAKMLDSMALELVKSGLHDLLLGGSKNTIGAEIFGTTGQGGGITGQIAQAFAGSAISTSLKNALSNAWTGLTGPITSVLGQAFVGIEGIIKSILGGALSGAGSGAASAGASAAGGAAAKALGNMDSSLVTLVAQSAMGLAQDAAYYAESLGDFIMMIITEATSVHPFGFEHGGIVPSAAGGMIVGGSGASLNILHPNEAVLPADITAGMIRAINGGTFGGGGDGGDSGTTVVVNFVANGVLNSDLRQHADTIADIVADKVRQARFTGQGVKRGAFRR
jgi:hypothetical protein